MGMQRRAYTGSECVSLDPHLTALTGNISTSALSYIASDLIIYTTNTTVTSRPFFCEILFMSVM